MRRLTGAGGEAATSGGERGRGRHIAAGELVIRRRVGAGEGTSFGSAAGVSSSSSRRASTGAIILPSC
eukprot:3328997-Prymnesium_polylepis.1